MKEKVIAGNWKMHKTLNEAVAFFDQFKEYINTTHPSSNILIAPPFPYLYVAKQIMGESIKLSAQDVAPSEQGAYTGDVSAMMVVSVGASAAIIGHSERRQYYGETGEILKRKVDQALQAGLYTIYCVGETFEERKVEKHFDIVRQQLEEGLSHITPVNLAYTMVAYEPVWAIGTGEVASPEQAQEMHAYIRKFITDKYSASVAREIPILYGGSVKPDNVESLFSQPDIDGGLIGGASLDISDFTKIIDIAEKMKTQ